MPTELEKTLWKAAFNYRYSEIYTIIKDNPDSDLINSIDEDTADNLTMCMIANLKARGSETPRELLSFLLTHPRLNWAYKSDSGSITTYLLDELLRSNDYSLLEPVKQIPGFFLSNDLLAYDSAKKMLQQAENSHKGALTRARNANLIEKARIKVEKCKHLVAVIRELTIEHATLTGNTDLIDLVKDSDRIDELKEAESALVRLSLLTHKAHAIHEEYTEVKQSITTLIDSMISRPR